MNILWLAPEPPIPPLSGGRERARRMLGYLAGRHAVRLVTFAATADRGDLAALAADLAGLEAAPYGHERAFRRAVRRAVRQHQPAAVHVQGLALWPLAPRKARRVLDLHDAPLQPGEADQRALAEAEAIITVSEADRAAVSGCGPVVAVLPNGVDVAYWSAPYGLADPATVLYPAALNWEPNIEGVRVLVDDVLPRLRERVPEARLIIAGRQPTPEVRALAASHPAVTLIPNPPDMRVFFAQATAIAVPTVARSGSRLKILQALAAGRPVASTPEGAAGLGLEPGTHLLAAPLVAPFAGALASLLTEPDLRARLVTNGQAIIPTRDWQHHLPVLDEVYPL